MIRVGALNQPVPKSQQYFLPTPPPSPLTSGFQKVSVSPQRPDINRLHLTLTPPTPAEDLPPTFSPFTPPSTPSFKLPSADKFEPLSVEVSIPLAEDLSEETELKPSISTITFHKYDDLGEIETQTGFMRLNWREWTWMLLSVIGVLLVLVGGVGMLENGASD